MLQKVVEVIELKRWINGSGWSCSETYSDKVIEIDQNNIEVPDWSWWECGECADESADTLIVVTYYAADITVRPLDGYRFKENAEVQYSEAVKARHSERRWNSLIDELKDGWCDLCEGEDHKLYLVEKVFDGDAHGFVPAAWIEVEKI